jgi:hypothetical protein
MSKAQPLCCMCGSFITGRSVQVWMNPVGTKQVNWQLAHPGCAALLDDDEDNAAPDVADIFPGDRLQRMLANFWDAADTKRQAEQESGR